jgi:anti-anti-sigma factor
MDTADDQVFGLGEVREGSRVRLSPRGELDIAASEQLSDRLDALAAEGAAVELDLSEVAFMDSTGVACVAQAVREWRQAGAELTVGGELQAQVARLLELVDGERLFWPDGR